MGRNRPGMDISATAAHTMNRCLKRIPGAAWPKVIGLPSTVENLRKLVPLEFQNCVIHQFHGRKSGDMSDVDPVVVVGSGL